MEAGHLQREPFRANAQVAPPAATLDRILTAQLAVAWAGERGDAPRLGWWRTDLTSEYGGEDLFRQLMPHTWRWATLQAAREAARRTDAAIRGRDHDPDRLFTLFRLGFELDERVDERLQDLKRAGAPPAEALPGLQELGVQKHSSNGWSKDAFGDWVAGHGSPDSASSPAGRRLKGSAPDSVELRIKHLVAALAPLTDEYPCPHYRIDG